MTKFVSSLLVVAVLGFSIPSSAYDHGLATCTTSDGQYTVNVDRNQIATLRDLHQVAVAEYAVELYQGIQPISFTRLTYQDTATKGEQFTLAGPSTNVRSYFLNVAFNVGEGSGRIQDAELNCTLFGGRFVNDEL